MNKDLRYRLARIREIWKQPIIATIRTKLEGGFFEGDYKKAIK